MFLRALTLSTLLAIVGCSDSGDETAVAERDASPSQLADLSFLTASTSVLPNSELALSVRYTSLSGEPLPSAAVDFSLVGSAAGASLSPSKAFTGADGVAMTTLRAGSTASDLMVRARVGDDLPKYLSVSVRPAVGTSLSVGVRYAGSRKLASYTVTSLPNMTCAQALSSGLAGDYAYNFSAPDQTASFAIGYGLSAALVGWGKDDSGSKLASGCSYFTAPVTEDAAAAKSTITLELNDVDLKLTSALALQLQIDASAVGQQLATVTMSATASVVAPGTFADAEFLLDGVQRSLTTKGNTAAASALAARRSSQALSSTLQPALTAKSVGPTAYGDALGKGLARRGASLLASWTLGASELSTFSAQSADGSEGTAFSALPGASIVTHFDTSTAALSVDSLQITLGLGSYARSVLTGFDTKPVDSAGCSVLASWWTQSALTDVLPSNDAQAACVASLAAIDEATQNALAALDSASPSLMLSGSVAAHDRNDDGKIDDVGPGDLTGSWGTAKLTASLQSPQRTALE